MALAQRLEGLLQATVLQICREIVPFTDTVSLTGDLSIEADSREVCRVTFRRNDPLKTPSPRVGELASMSEILSGNRQNLVDSLVAEAMKVWYNEGPSPDRSRVQEIRAEYAQDSRKSIAVELGVEAMTKYGQISPETLEAAAQLRRLADQPVIQFESNNKRDKHERKQKLIANDDFESTPLNAKCCTPVKNNNGMYACPDCGKEFTFGTNLTRHQRNFHNRPFSRKKSDAKKLELTENNANLLNTLDENENESSSEKKSYTCVLCERVFSQLGALGSHLHEMHSMTMPETQTTRSKDDLPGCHPCPTCGQTFSYALNLQRHIQSMHKDVNTEQLTCELCNMKFSKQSMLTRHTRKVHKMVRPAEPIEALPSHAPPPYTPQNPPGPYTALMHSPLITPTTNTIQYTDITPPDSSSPNDPTPAPEVYTKVIHCSLCSSQFSFRTNLMRHMQQAHKNHGTSSIATAQRKVTKAKKRVSSPRHRHTCPICQLSFTFRTNFTRHMRKQHNQVPEEQLAKVAN